MKVIFTLLSFVACTMCCRNGQLLGNRITNNIKQEILDHHNYLRSKVALGLIRGQPPAKNMLQLHWDAELAKKAQDWANNCVFQHDSSEHRRVSRFLVGQNLAIQKTSYNDGSQPKFGDAINDWFQEHNDYNYSPIGRNQQTGHYTQQVWADTYYVGCGYAYYLKDGWYNKYYVCNYGPAGNYIGRYPYDAGQPSCHNYNYKSSAIKGLCTLLNLHSSENGEIFRWRSPYIFSPLEYSGQGTEDDDGLLHRKISPFLEECNY